MSPSGQRFDTSAALASPAALSTSAVAPLSEDVSSLLQWGRGLLQQQRAQRRQSSHESVDSSDISHTEVERSRSVYTTSSRQMVRSSAFTDPPSGSVGLALAKPPLYTQAYVQELRQRHAHLQAAEAARTQACEQRWTRLLRGRARLLREWDPSATAEHTHHVQQTVKSVQAVVEGEEALTEFMQDVVQCLADTALQQEHSREEAERKDEFMDATNVTNSTQDPSVDSTASGEQEEEEQEQEQGQEEKTSQLISLLSVIRRQVRKLISLQKAQQAAEAEQERQSRVALHKQQESIEEAKAKLHAIRKDIQRATAEEETLHQELQQLQATRAAQRHAAEIYKASMQRRKTIQQTLHRMAQLQAEAETRSAIARHELAASEALFTETQIALEMAVEEHNNVTETLARAKKTHNERKRRLLTAEEDCAALRRAVREVDRQCAEVREQRRACEADTEALLDATRERRLRQRDTWGENEGDGRIGSRNDVRVRWPEAVDRPTDRLAALQCELPTLKAELASLEADNAALQDKEDQLLEKLRVEKEELCTLRAQKASFESYLTSVEASRES